MSDTKVEYVFDQHKSQPPQVISMTQERYDAAIAEARAAEREQCCKDVCSYCEKGLPLYQAKNVLDENGPKQWAHKVPGSTFSKLCNAYAIRQRIAQEQAGEKGLLTT
jgi:glutamine synthetase